MSNPVNGAGGLVFVAYHLNRGGLCAALQMAVEEGNQPVAADIVTEMLRRSPPHPDGEVLERVLNGLAAQTPWLADIAAECRGHRRDGLEPARVDDDDYWDDPWFSDAELDDWFSDAEEGDESWLREGGRG